MKQSLPLDDIETVANRIRRIIDDGNPPAAILPDVMTLLNLILKEKE